MLFFHPGERVLATEGPDTGKTLTIREDLCNGFVTIAEPRDYPIERWWLERITSTPLSMAQADRIDGYDRDDLGESPDY